MLSTDNKKYINDKISILATDLQSKFMDSFPSWIEMASILNGLV